MMRRLPAIVAALLLLASYADAAITSVSLNRAGLVTELTLTLDHPAPKMHLSAHGNDLWIDLDRTALQIPPRPLLGREVAPIGVVRVFSPDGTHTRIMVEVIGKCDYAIVQRQDEILLRLAPSGQVANLSAPLRPQHHRTTTYSSVTTTAVQPVVIHAPAPEVANSVTLLPPGNQLVMIDPGHGGYDPGTQSDSGILEKDVALEISRQARRCAEGTRRAHATDAR